MYTLIGHEAYSNIYIYIYIYLNNVIDENDPLSE